MSRITFSLPKYFLLLLLVSFCHADNPEERGEYMEGDILSVAPSLEIVGQTRAGLRDEKFRWPQATIPYEFSAGYPSYQKLQFNRAIKHISDRTCIKFKPRTTETDYIRVVTTRGCSSHMGRIGGAQDVSLSSGCTSLGTHVHELIHALGFHHEQSRADRDDFVTVHYENIRPETKQNFDSVRGNNMFQSFNVPYDYGSVMHYSSTAFSRNGRMTIVPKKAGAAIGQRTGMSSIDVQKVNNMYCKGAKQGETRQLSL